MENQHQKITGYRDLSQEEIDLMNEVKAKAAECGDLCARLRFMSDRNRAVRDPSKPEEPLLFELDGRWVSIGTTHLQEGFMALVRSIAKPTTF